MKKVRAGVIGFGNIGKLHCVDLKNIEEVELTAICNRSLERFENVEDLEIDFDHPIDIDVLAKAVKEAKLYQDYKVMFARENLDLVVVAVPHKYHKDIILKAFSENLHVIAEKPLTISAAASREICEAYQEKDDLVFSVMFQKRVSGINSKIKEIIDNNVIGKIRRINWIKTDWFRTQIYYNTGGWRGTWQGEGGGVLINQAFHNLDLFQWFFGLPEEVTAIAELGKWHDIPVEDDVSALMKMKNGATASFITSTGDSPGTDRLEITGNKGKLVVENNQLVFEELNKPLQLIIEEAEEGFLIPDTEKKQIQFEERPPEHAVITENVVNNILGKEELLFPGTQGLNAVQLMNTIIYSGLKNERLKFPVAEEKYLNLLEEMKQKERKE